LTIKPCKKKKFFLWKICFAREYDKEFVQRQVMPAFQQALTFVCELCKNTSSKAQVFAHLLPGLSIVNYAKPGHAFPRCITRS
jgi:hypothetical protein